VNELGVQPGVGSVEDFRSVKGDPQDAGFRFVKEDVLVVGVDLFGWRGGWLKVGGYW
jgi:hypothetical protein